MAEVLSGIPKLVIPDADALIVGAVATPELMALLNEIKRSLDKVRGANFPEPEGITPSQLADDFGAIILDWVTLLDAAVHSTTSIMPYDNSKPQVSEGAEALSQSYTPKRSDSKIFIEATYHQSVTAGGGNGTAALFMSSQNDCLASARSIGVTTIRAELDSWGTTSRTFSLRHGPQNTGTSYIGSNLQGVAIYDNAMLSVLTIIERKATPIPA